MWARNPGFDSLVYTVIEQQVSLASARATYQRLRKEIGSITPEAFGRLGAETLRQLGFSRQKAGYCQELAKAALAGDLDLEYIANQSDDRARDTLMAHRGIGRWTADIYLLHSLLRTDIWPVGDLALINGLKSLKARPGKVNEEWLEKTAEPWRPWRSVAARVIWHYYLCESGTTLE